MSSPVSRTVQPAPRFQHGAGNFLYSSTSWQWARMLISDQGPEILVTDKFGFECDKKILVTELVTLENPLFIGVFGLFVTSDILFYIKSFFQNRREGARDARLYAPIRVYNSFLGLVTPELVTPTAYGSSSSTSSTKESGTSVMLRLSLYCSARAVVLKGAVES